MSKNPSVGTCSSCLAGIRATLGLSSSSTDAAGRLNHGYSQHVGSDALPARKAPWPKTLVLVRHGESTYNQHYEETHADPMNLWDAPLTALGHTQAQAAGAELRAYQAELIVTSPLTRAIQTCLEALPQQSTGLAHDGGRYEVRAALAEHLEASCDIGRPPAELQKDFPMMNFGHLPDVWWWYPEDSRESDPVSVASSRQLFSDWGRREPARDFHKRVDEVAAWLSTREEENTIALFAHADFFHAFLHRHFSQREHRFENYWMKNCEVLAVQVDRPVDLLSPFEPPAPVEQEIDLPRPAALSTVAPLPAAAPNPAMKAISRLKHQLSQENPDLNPGQITRQTSLKWKNMSADTRAAEMKLAMDSDAV